MLTSIGRHHEALEAINQALRLDPKPPANYLLVFGQIQFALRQYAAAIDSLAKADSRQWVGKAPKWYRAASLAYLGRLDEARHELNKVVSETSWSKDQNITYLRLVAATYRQERDREHYLEGLRLAGLTNYPFGFEPTEHEAERLRGATLKQLFSSGSLKAFRRAGLRDITIRIDEQGVSTWQIRHDMTDTSPVEFEDDQVCFRLENYFKNHRLCFMAFRNAGAARDREYKDFQYRLIGPAHFLVSRGDQSNR